MPPASALAIPRGATQFTQGSDWATCSSSEDLLMLGGDLAVTVGEAEGLTEGGSPHLTCLIEVLEAGPSAPQRRTTSIQWGTLTPSWQEQVFFRLVSAASEVRAYIYDLAPAMGPMGRRKGSHALLQRISSAPAGSVLGGARLVGFAAVPLQQTVEAEQGGPPCWYPLLRPDGSRTSCGRLTLGFHWEVTSRSLLELRMRVLERVLGQRKEILASLTPLGPAEAREWLRGSQRPEPQQPQKGQDDDACQRIPTLGLCRTALDTALAGGASQADTDLASSSDPGQLTLQVIAARGLRPLRGLGRSLVQADPLPKVFVEISAAGNGDGAVRRTPVAQSSMAPVFDSKDSRFSWDPVPRSTIATIRLFRERRVQSPELLGQTEIPCARAEGQSPVFAWLQLQLPPKLQQAARMERPEVLVRVQWRPAEAMGARRSVQFRLAGAGLTLLSSGSATELLHISLDRVRLSGFLASTERRIVGRIGSLQVDNQSPDAPRPCVLAPEFRQSGHLRGDKWADVARLELVQGLVPGQSEPLSILSLREVSISLRPLELQVNDALLATLVSYSAHLPLAKLVWGGAMGAAGPGDTPSHWLEERWQRELASMRGASTASSYVFLESASLEEIHVRSSVTITSSTVMEASRGIGLGPGADQETRLARWLSSGGFQLVNVSGVPLHFRGVSYQGLLVSWSTLMHILIRHYLRQAIAEAPKASSNKFCLRPPLARVAH